MVSAIYHAATSRLFIQQAEEELAQGDLLQAAEKKGGDPRRTLFQVASVTHQNYYEGWLDAEDLAHNLADIRTLLGLLDRVPTTQ